MKGIPGWIWWVAAAIVFVIVFIGTSTLDSDRRDNHPTIHRRITEAPAQEFYLQAGEELLTVYVDATTYHKIKASNEFEVLARLPDGSRKVYSMPAGDSGWNGDEPAGLLRVRGKEDGTSLEFWRVR